MNLEDIQVPMPKFGSSVSGAVTAWFVQVGDEVAVDEPLAEVETEKVTTELLSPTAGEVTRLHVPLDEEVSVGATLVTIRVSP